MAVKFDDKGMLIIRNARINFPHLFEKPVINGQEGKCGGILLLDPAEHKPFIDAVQAQIEALQQAKWQGKIKVPTAKLCLRDGDDDTRPEHAGYMVLSANSKDRPLVLAANGSPVTDPAKNPIYGGCRVNAKVSLWAQDNQYGKRINATLIAVQFAGDDTPLDGTYVSAEVAAEGFEPVSADDPMLS